MNGKANHDKQNLFDAHTPSAQKTSGMDSQIVITRISSVAVRPRKTVSRHENDTHPVKTETRFAIYSGRRKLGVVQSEMIARLGIRVGQAVGQEVLAMIKRDALLDRMRQHAGRLLASRAHSCAQLQAKLEKKFADSDRLLIDDVIGDLIERGLLDDEEFVNQLIESLSRTGPVGNQLLKDRLTRAGISDGALIERAFQRSRSTSESESRRDETRPDPLTAADLERFLLEKYRHDHGSDPRRAAARLFRAGISRGFDAEQVQDCVERLMGGDLANAWPRQ